MGKRCKRSVCLLLSLLMLGSMVFAMSGCADKKGNSTFSWFIPKADGSGEYYETYEQSLPIQWLNNQTWDTGNKTLSTDGTGNPLKLEFEVPISGSESDYLGTMFASGEYADIIDLTYSTSSSLQLVEDGVLMEITEYVEQYMPNYVAMLEANPDLMEIATIKDADGNRHYYSLYQLSDVPNENFMGYVYRRDWLVKYADVPSHVWDRDAVLSDIEDPTSVDTSKIHYTDYYEAQKNNDWTGWKDSGVTAFTYSEGNDPNNDYTDNVIFPSGSTEPIYISDWEWMFRAFAKALAAEGLANDPNAYATTLYYEGALGTGDLYSSFGSGNPFWYYNTDENGHKYAQFGADSDTMETYLTAMHNWYQQGWLDKSFNERTEMFYLINQTGFAEGKVGLTQVGLAYVGDTIRKTQHANKTTDAMLMTCKLPINDLYGDASHKFLIPDSMYAEALISNPTGISTAAEGKDLATLFSMLNWLYSEEGYVLTKFGLSEEQYKSMTFENDYYATLGITSAFDIIDGKYCYCKIAANDSTMQKALRAQRLSTSPFFNLKRGNVYDKMRTQAIVDWGYYMNQTEITKYTQFMSEDNSNTYNNKLSQIRTYFDQHVPNLIKSGLGEWETFKAVIGKYNYAVVNDIYNEIFESLS